MVEQVFIIAVKPRNQNFFLGMHIVERTREICINK